MMPSSVQLLLLVVMVAVADTGVHGRHGSGQPTADQLAELRWGPCPARWTYSHNKCYRLSPQPAVFRQADSLCDMLSRTSRLATADTAQTAHLMRALYREASRTLPLTRRPLPALWVRPQPQEFTRRARQLRSSYTHQQPSVYYRQGHRLGGGSPYRPARTDRALTELVEAATASASAPAAADEWLAYRVPLDRRTMLGEYQGAEEECPVLQIGGGLQEDSQRLQCRSLLHYVCELDASVVNETDL